MYVASALLQPPPPLVKTVWEERPSSRQSGKSGRSLGSTMTKVGGTAKRSKVKSSTKTTAQRIDVSASWTGPDSGIEVWCHKVFLLLFQTFIKYSTALQY